MSSVEILQRPDAADAYQRLAPAIAARVDEATWNWWAGAPGSQDAPFAALSVDAGQINSVALALPLQLRVGTRRVAGALTGGSLEFGDADLSELRRVLLSALQSASMDLLLSVLPAQITPPDLFTPLEIFDARSLSLRLARGGISPLRRLAREARRIRMKLNPVPLDEATLRRASALFESGTRDNEVGPDRSVEYLKWRFVDCPFASIEALQYRRRAGQGLDGFVLFDRTVDEEARKTIRLLDFYTRDRGRRAFAVLLGELGLWAVSEEYDRLRMLVVPKSAPSQAAVGMGALRGKVEHYLHGCWLGAGSEPPWSDLDFVLSAADLGLTL